jgi:hypothetical protein
MLFAEKKLCRVMYELKNKNKGARKAEKNGKPVIPAQGHQQSVVRACQALVE